MIPSETESEVNSSFDSCAIYFPLPPRVNAPVIEITIDVRFSQSTTVWMCRLVPQLLPNTEYFEKSKMEPIGHVVVDLEGKEYETVGNTQFWVS